MEENSFESYVKCYIIALSNLASQHEHNFELEYHTNEYSHYLKSHLYVYTLVKYYHLP